MWECGNGRVRARVEGIELVHGPIELGLEGLDDLSDKSPRVI